MADLLSEKHAHKHNFLKKMVAQVLE